MNKVILMGRLTADPELKTTQSGVAVSSFSIAVDRDYAPEGGERQADFINIVTWRKTAEFVSRYFQKGKPIIVFGEIQIRKYEDKTGQTRYATDVVADEVKFVLSDGTQRHGDNATGNEAPGGNSHNAGTGPAMNDSKDYTDDDLPF